MAKDSEQGDPPPVLAGYEEPSLVFALGADTGLSDGKGAAEIGAKGGGLALVDDAERPQFLARLAELQADATAVDEVSGFNYSRGKKVHVTVYRVSAARSDDAADACRNLCEPVWLKTIHGNARAMSEHAART